MIFAKIDTAVQTEVYEENMYKELVNIFYKLKYFNKI